MYVQPGDWVCSSCGFVNWRRRRVCMRCFPFADSNEMSKSIANGALLAAQLAAGLDPMPEIVASLPQPQKANTVPSSQAHGQTPSFQSATGNTEATHDGERLTVHCAKFAPADEACGSGMPVWQRGHQEDVATASASQKTSSDIHSLLSSVAHCRMGVPKSISSTAPSSAPSPRVALRSFYPQEIPAQTPDVLATTSLTTSADLPWHSKSQVWSHPTTPRFLPDKPTNTSPVESPALLRSLTPTETGMKAEGMPPSSGTVGSQWHAFSNAGTSFSSHNQAHASLFEGIGRMSSPLFNFSQAHPTTMSQSSSATESDRSSRESLFEIGRRSRDGDRQSPESISTLSAANEQDEFFLPLNTHRRRATHSFDKTLYDDEDDKVVLNCLPISQAAIEPPRTSSQASS